MPTSSTTSALQFEVPDKVRSALEAYAAERNYSIDFVMELALSQFLDLDGVTFDDCDPVMSPGQLREENEILKYRLASSN
jgi:predicted transcriptional regulator